jgi:hypothetical protein
MTVWLFVISGTVGRLGAAHIQIPKLKNMIAREILLSTIEYERTLQNDEPLRYSFPRLNMNEHFRMMIPEAARTPNFPLLVTTRFLVRKINIQVFQYSSSMFL